MSNGAGEQLATAEQTDRQSARYTIVIAGELIRLLCCLCCIVLVNICSPICLSCKCAQMLALVSHLGHVCIAA